MLRIVTLAACLVLVAPAAADERDDAMKALQGTWVLETAELGGQPVNEIKGLELTLTDMKYAVNYDDRVERGSFTFDPKKAPKEMDITPENGPNKGKKYLAIYEVAKDSLKVCYDLAGKDRPKKFETTEKTPQTLLTHYKRKK